MARADFALGSKGSTSTCIRRSQWRSARRQRKHCTGALTGEAHSRRTLAVRGPNSVRRMGVVRDRSRQLCAASDPAEVSCQPAAASALVLLWKWPANSRPANSRTDTAIAHRPPAMRIFVQRLLPPPRLPLASGRSQRGDPHIPQIRRRTLAMLPIGHSRCLLS
jgi:hypothetical protein